MKKTKIVIVVLISLTVFSCKKYLEAKPDAKLATPSSLRDMQSLLDNYDEMNNQFPAGSEIYCDNYYLTDDDWAGIYDEYQRDYYLWKKDDQNIGDWQAPYKNIYTCNLVLETLPTLKVSATEKTLSDNIRGTALFFRASYFYSVVQLFAKTYDSLSASSDPGIPLRLSTDFTKQSTRASVQETYAQIIYDFKKSVQLLPVSVSLKSRPCKAAAYGALARTYLSMQDYTDAGNYGDSCLALSNSLMDFNSLDSNAAYPIERFNEEVIFQSLSLSVDPLEPSICKIDSNLYNSYDSGDLRKVILFMDNGDGSYGFKGDYDGGSDNYGHSFTGIVTDEQYLILAECDARLGKIQQSLQYLNTLLEKRWKNTDFTPVTSTDPVELLTIILNERRKELLFRGIRTSDLKRLNKDPRFEKTLTRNLNGQLYTLQPNDGRYVAQIPKIVIDLAQMNQNP